VTGCGGAPGRQATTAANGSPGASASSEPAIHCGRARTAAGVPVDVEIVGQANCRAAMTVERAYSRALASGKVPGNGGGAPVTIQGWICQGYDTSQVLATGRASACRKHGSQILAVLPSISPSPPSS
ncbi:MAG: hypothetical protein J2P30_02810, partial [Actinobacteria bacterium]|nr:hypothetical protein [Actinomycetota bacterium]